MSRKLAVTILISVSLLTMLLPWFGGQRGVQEIDGLIMLENPIAIGCIIIMYIGLWLPLGYKSDIIAMIGMLGYIAMQVYEFLTWHILTISGRFDLQLSFHLCYPEFYLSVVTMSLTFFIVKWSMIKEDIE